MDAIPIKAAAAAATALVAGATYLDGRFSIRHDLRERRQENSFGKRLQDRITQLGSHTTLYHMLELADVNAEALWFEGRTWTYQQLKQETDALAEAFYQHGLRPGAFAAVFMTNSPEMVVTAYALSKLGVVPALINTALRNETLLHCLAVADASSIISTPDLTGHLSELFGKPHMAEISISVSLGSFPTPESQGPTPDNGETTIQIGKNELAAAALSHAVTPPPRGLKDVGQLIYTSGTSGKPKAVSIKNFQNVIVSTPTAVDCADPSKNYPIRTFSCLPLFHATCYFIGLCYSVGTSSTFCVARKFSASGFSKALAESKATRMLYVGELCRYLLKAPVSPYDKAHACRVATGNGLQKDVWKPFCTRFGIEEVREFYRSTEGIARFDNISSGEAGIGRVGFGGPLHRFFNSTTYLVKYDSQTEAPYRDPKTGFCVLAKAGEAGEAIGRVTTMDFYAEYLNNPKANGEKLISDVFRKGDLFQRTGDLLIRDKHGWISFADRSGDTFRWRGENVSTGEVRDHIAKIPGVTDVTVYAMKLDGYDGQAGAAAITLKDPANEAAFAGNLYKQLRSQGLTEFQVPRLVRFIEQIEVTATFKHLKTAMKTKSWDPTEQKDGETVWWLDNNKFKKLDSESWLAIKTGKARL